MIVGVQIPASKKKKKKRKWFPGDSPQILCGWFYVHGGPFEWETFRMSFEFCGCFYLEIISSPSFRLLRLNN